HEPDALRDSSGRSGRGRGQTLAAGSACAVHRGAHRSRTDGAAPSDAAAHADRGDRWTVMIECLPAALAEEFGGHVSGVRVRGARLDCTVPPEGLAALARWLRASVGADLVLMVGADRRLDRGGFEVHYLFAHERENWFLHATVGVAAGRPEIPSLATFHYPA